MTFRKVLVASLGVCLALLPLASVSMAAEGKRSDRFLTGPQEGEAIDLALSYLHANYKTLNLTPADLSELKVTDQYVSSHNGTTHIFFGQHQHGIPVFNGLIGVHVASDGSIIHLTNGFVSDLASRISTTSAQLGAEQAILKAADHLGMSAVARAPRLVEADGSRDSAALYDGAGISRRDIRVNQTYIAKDGAIRLAWQVEIDQIGSSDWLDLMVDAENGELLGQFNRTSHVGDPFESYLVFPLPGEHPEDTSQVLVVDPADPTASPNGWHDTDGDPEREFTDTRGRNVHAYDDIDADNNPDSTWVSGTEDGDELEFNFPFDAGQGPTGGTNREAAIVNLFYWNNIMHDLTYHYGFDPASGNFEDADPVNAEAQDGSGTNNANFSTPSEGNRPRMQMFVWTAPPAFVVNSPGGIAGTYDAAGASFGAALAGQTGNLALVNDGDDEGGAGSTTDACQALPAGSMNGLIALIDRGSCEFGLKVLNAENAGAIAAVVVNNQGDGVLTMGPGVNGGSVTIAGMFIGQGTGDLVKAELFGKNGGGVNVTLSAAVDPNRDSDMDAGVISHEYGHGVSIRLTGGPTNVFCLSGDEQAGEGWSDFWALVLFADETDTRTTTRGVGNYLIFQDGDGSGIRNFPYSTDMMVNPQTYADISGTNVPHGVGEIWAGMLWELYWNLVDKHGFDTDLYTGTGGNNLTMQLMVDGLKLQGCNPTFVAARDAILTADANDNGGANACEIWRAFAKRGVGTGAAAGTTGVGDETEDFNVPVECLVDIFDDGFESGDTSMWSSTTP